jgi:hypothetical protein
MSTNQVWSACPLLLQQQLPGMLKNAQPCLMRKNMQADGKLILMIQEAPNQEAYNQNHIVAQTAADTDRWLICGTSRQQNVGCHA